MEKVLSSPVSFTGSVPGDVNEALFLSGKLPDYRVGLNYRKYHWVRERSWWYRKLFRLRNSWRRYEKIELCLDGLDVYADIWINGKYLGNHPSVFYPFWADITEFLDLDSENTLLVRVTCGLDHVKGHDEAHLLDAVKPQFPKIFADRDEKGRIFLRKPAFVWGSAFSPSLPSCGITGAAEIRAHNKTEITAITPMLLSLEKGNALVGVCMEIERLRHSGPAEVTARICLINDRGTPYYGQAEQVLGEGVNFVNLQVRISDPELWWPAGMGSQHLYTLHAMMYVGGRTRQNSPLRFGLRSLTQTTGVGRYCINGAALPLREVLFVPQELVATKDGLQNTETTLAAAAQAGFTVVRCSSLGGYQTDFFYTVCQRLGLLVRQELPGLDQPMPTNLLDPLRREVTYQAERMGRRTAALDVVVPGYHDDIKRILHSAGVPVCPENTEHHRSIGFSGTPSLASASAYLNGNEESLTGEVFRQHLEVFSDSADITAIIRQEYADIESMDTATRYLLSGMCQGFEMERSLDQLRSQGTPAQIIINRLNDCWGQAGYGLLDLRGNAKPAYYFVSRALKPLRMILTTDEKKQEMHCILINDTGVSCLADIQLGFIRFDGSWSDVTDYSVEVPAFSRAVAGHYPVPDLDYPQEGAVFAIPNSVRLRSKTGDTGSGYPVVGLGNPLLHAAVKRFGPFKNLALPEHTPEVVSVQETERGLSVELHSDVYIHGVHIKEIQGVCVSDCYFDLYPGESRQILLQAPRRDIQIGNITGKNFS